MAWKDRLQKASFRDVPFEVEGDSGKFGRRVQTHEFPQRDKPYTEDLGRAARGFKLQAFVIGGDCLEKRDALLNALEKGGPGTLVHPWYGRLNVDVTDFTVSHSITSNGVCEFEISFVESGELTFPTAAASPGAQTLLAADALQEVAEADFLKHFDVQGFPAFVAEGAFSDVEAFLGQVSGAMGGLTHVLASPVQSILEAIGMPSALQPNPLLVQLRGLYNRASSVLQVAAGFGSSIGGFGVHARNRDAVLSLSRLSSTLGVSAVAPTAVTPSGIRRQENTEALASLLQRATLVQAAGMASTMAIPVYDDGIQIRAALSAALDAASATAPDEVYDALQALRARSHADITSRLTNAARLVTVTPREIVPALVLSYDRYEDATRDQEIVERNGIRHPGFVPVKPQRLLAS